MASLWISRGRRTVGRERTVAVLNVAVALLPEDIIQVDQPLIRSTCHACCQALLLPTE
jgi:hypothetical protein